MKRILLVLFASSILVSHASAGTESVERGMQLFRKHHYHDAAQVMYAGISEIPAGRQNEAQLKFGMVCLANARFYDRLHQTAKPLQIEYLKRLVAVDDRQGGKISVLAMLYLAKAYIANHQPNLAIPCLTKLIKTSQMSSADRHDAQIALGLAYHLDGKKKQSKALWSKVPNENPQTAAVLAWAYQRAGIQTQQLLALADSVTARLNTGKGSILPQCASALLGIYSQQDMPDKGFDILSRTDLKQFARKEIVGPHKELYFYDADLLQNIAAISNAMAIRAFDRVKESDNSPNTAMATFLTGEAYAYSNRLDKAAKVVETLLSTDLPKALSHRTQIRHAAYTSPARGQRSEANKLSAFLTPNSNAAQVSDIILICARLGIECPKALKRATALWQQSHGRPPLGLGMALGRYYRSRENHTQTLQFLEAARDKSRKNRIDANPPVMLADLAWAYYHNRQYSEALEIYFTMSQQFPAVRQIQVALQGIYSMEQQSAGDAKIF